MSTNILEGFVPRPELARQVKKSERTLERLESKGEGPPVTYIGRTPYYNVERAREWLQTRERSRKGVRHARRSK
jgi:hypothetical protein